MDGEEFDFRRIAAAVTAAREANGWTREHVAMRAGFSTVTINYLERPNHGARLSHRMRPFLEAALGWAPGTYEAIGYGRDLPERPQPTAP